MPDQASEPIVSFYLTQETDLPIRLQGYLVVTIDIEGQSGELVAKPALRVTFSPKSSIAQSVGLIAFGSDPRCQVLLPADVADPVQCKVYAQLNSGPHVWIIEDSSARGTEITGDKTNNLPSRASVVGRRYAMQGLQYINFGAYCFRIRAPTIEADVRLNEEWFRRNKPVPVTKLMFEKQLGSSHRDFQKMNLIGKGGYGLVFKCMEKHTALRVAIKEEKVERPEDQQRVLKEVKYMETLSHSYLVDIIRSERGEDYPLKHYTIMPLYIGNLWTLLERNPDTPMKEQTILQIFEGMSYMHQHQILHRDLKPDNIFWVTESPSVVKIGDYGLATSLADYPSLSETCGTTAYAAPEVFQRTIQTTAADVFSLGATVFAILEYDAVIHAWYQSGNPPQTYNRVFEAVARSPPKLYAGLVQSMMAPNPKDRPSLRTCIEVVKGKQYNWTKAARLAPAPAVARAAAPIAAIHQDAHRPGAFANHKPTYFGQWAAKRNVDPTPLSPLAKAAIRQTPKPREPWAAKKSIKPTAPAPVLFAAAQPAPKPREPAPASGVSFQDGLPSYEEATSQRQNPFARLADSREHIKCRRQPKQPTRMTRGQQGSQPSRQLTRRPHERSQALEIRRTGTGRIQKATLARIKAGTRDMAKGTLDMAKGTLDMAVGLYQFCRGLGVTTCNIGCLTGQGALMLYDIAAGNHPSPTVLNADSMQIVVSMRVVQQQQQQQSLRRPANAAAAGAFAERATEEGPRDARRRRVAKGPVERGWLTHGRGGAFAGV